MFAGKRVVLIMKSQNWNGSYNGMEKRTQ